MLAETFMDLVRSGPHWLFELMLEAITALALAPLARLLLRRHDARKHPVAEVDDRVPCPTCNLAVGLARTGHGLLTSSDGHVIHLESACDYCRASGLGVWAA